MPVKTADGKNIALALHLRRWKDSAGLRKSHPLYVPYRYLVMASIFTSREYDIRDIHSFGCSKNAISGPPFYTDGPHSSRNSSNSSNSEMHSVTINALVRARARAYNAFRYIPGGFCTDAEKKGIAASIFLPGEK